MDGGTRSGASRRPVMQKDDDARTCEFFNCNVAFGFFSRRHHCRGCGYIYCAEHCSNYKPIPHMGYDAPVRVCNTCYHKAHIHVSDDDEPGAVPVPSGAQSATTSRAGSPRVSPSRRRRSSTMSPARDRKAKKEKKDKKEKKEKKEKGKKTKRGARAAAAAAIAAEDPALPSPEPSPTASSEASASKGDVSPPRLPAMGAAHGEIVDTSGCRALVYAPAADATQHTALMHELLSRVGQLEEKLLPQPVCFDDANADAVRLYLAPEARGVTHCVNDDPRPESTALVYHREGPALDFEDINKAVLLPSDPAVLRGILTDVYRFLGGCERAGVVVRHNARDWVDLVDAAALDAAMADAAQPQQSSLNASPRRVTFAMDAGALVPYEAPPPPPPPPVAYAVVEPTTATYTVDADTWLSHHDPALPEPSALPTVLPQPVAAAPAPDVPPPAPAAWGAPPQPQPQQPPQDTRSSSSSGCSSVVIGGRRYLLDGEDHLRRIEMLEVKLASETLKNMEVNAAYAEATAERDAAAARAVGLEAANASLSAELEAARQHAASDAHTAADTDTLRRDLAAARQQTLQAQAEHRHTTHDLAAAQTRIVELEAVVKGKTDALAATERVLDEKGALTGALQAQLDLIACGKSGLANELQAANVRVSELTADLHEKARHVDTMAEANAELKREVAVLEAGAAASAEKLAAAAADLDGARQSAESKLAALEELVALARSERGDVEVLLTQTRGELASAGTASALLEKDLAAARAQVAHTEAALDERTRALEAKEDALAETTATLRDVQTQLMASQQEHIAGLSAHQHAVAELNARLAARHDEHRSEVDDLRRAIAAGDAEQRQLAAKLDDRTAAVEEMQAGMVEKEVAAAEERARYKAEVDRIRHTLDKATAAHQADAAVLKEKVGEYERREQEAKDELHRSRVALSASQREQRQTAKRLADEEHGHTATRGRLAATLLLKNEQVAVVGAAFARWVRFAHTRSAAAQVAAAETTQRRSGGRALRQAARSKAVRLAQQRTAFGAERARLFDVLTQAFKDEAVTARRGRALARELRGVRDELQALRDDNDNLCQQVDVKTDLVCALQDELAAARANPKAAAKGKKTKSGVDPVLLADWQRRVVLLREKALEEMNAAKQAHSMLYLQYEQRESSFLIDQLQEGRRADAARMQKLRDVLAAHPDVTSALEAVERHPRYCGIAGALKDLCSQTPQKGAGTPVPGSPAPVPPPACLEGSLDKDMNDKPSSSARGDGGSASRTASEAPASTPPRAASTGSPFSGPLHAVEAASTTPDERAESTGVAAGMRVDVTPVPPAHMMMSPQHARGPGSVRGTPNGGGPEAGEVIYP